MKPALCAVLAVLAACDTTEPTETEKTESHQAFAVCRFDSFSVEVTEGPSAGLTVAGALNAVEHPATGQLFGTLETEEGEVAWTGHYQPGGRISVAFEVGEALITGSGPIGGALCAEGSPIEGIAFGPTIAADFGLEGTDTGHWILSSPTESLVVFEYDDGSGTQLGLPPAGTETQLTVSGGVVTRNNCRSCGGTARDGVCVGPAGSGAAEFSECISGVVRGSNTLIGFLIQTFDL